MKLILEAEDATLAHMNTGTEKHGDEESGRVDLKLKLSTSGKVLDQLMSRNSDKADIFDDEKGSLVDHVFDRDGRPRMHHVTEITLDTEFEKHIVTLNNDNGMRLTDTKVNKFRVVPIGGGQVELTLRVQCHPTPEQVATLYEWQKKVIVLDIEPDEAALVATKAEETEEQEGSGEENAA